VFLSVGQKKKSPLFSKGGLSIKLIIDEKS